MWLMARATYLHSSVVNSRTCFPSHRSSAALSYSNNLTQILPFSSRRHFLLSFNQYENPLKLLITAQARRSFSSSREEAFASAADLLYGGPLKIVKYPEPFLRVKNKRVKTFDENLKKIVDEMFDIMYRTDGIGLSAPQVGINIQLMVFNTFGERGEGEEIVLVNPRITRYSKKIVPYNEGCLSFPGIYADVEVSDTEVYMRTTIPRFIYLYYLTPQRPDSLKVEAQDITGAEFELNLTGLPARVFQHEYDHLLGILFFDRMSDEVLDSIRVDLQAMEKSYEERTGSPSPEKIDKRRRKMKAVGFGKS
ncbi:peptide deformylase 1B, chloroplastic isoform X1 [Primulina huaijiensis]|uniref:peptide deformylase 1B, chloroplastic isoform X1 n=1 Tax=Primulina huaijiensis TaxID=1492673 RepID=UPI003CC73A8B